MAINLKKESYSNNADTDTVKTVCPEQDSEENTDENYYPRQVFPENYGVPEIYPQRKSSAENYYPKQAFPEKYDVPEIYPSQSVRTENTAVPYKSSEKDVLQNRGHAANTYSKGFNKALVIILSFLIVISVIGIPVSLAGSAKPGSKKQTVSYPAVTGQTVTGQTRNYSGYDAVEAEYGADEVDALVIEGIFTSITVTENYDGRITARAHKHDDCTCTFDINNKILTVSCQDSDADAGAYITIPPIYGGSVTVNSYAASEGTYINCYMGKNISITAEFGKAKLHGLNRSSASVSIEKGSIEINDCEMNKCDLYVDDGNISIWNSNILKKCTARANGVIDTYSSAFFSEFEACGQIDLEKTVFDRKASLTAADGYIKGEDIDFKDIYINSQNSSVNISTNDYPAQYTVILNSDENSAVHYEPFAPSGQGSNMIELDLIDSEAYFTFGN